MRIIYLLLSVAALTITSYFFERSITTMDNFNDAIFAALTGILAIIALAFTWVNFEVIGKPIARLFRKRKRGRRLLKVLNFIIICT